VVLYPCVHDDKKKKKKKIDLATHRHRHCGNKYISLLFSVMHVLVICQEVRSNIIYNIVFACKYISAT
jgi:hypothetical protein